MQGSSSQQQVVVWKDGAMLHATYISKNSTELSMCFLGIAQDANQRGIHYNVANDLIYDGDGNVSVTKTIMAI